MGKIYESITPKLEAWISQQKMFFVATAPISADGHVNCSPKGLDSFRVLGPKSVAYQDLTGSGIETVSHIKENGRIVLMFCAFDGAPRIVRLYGRGNVVEPGAIEFDQLVSKFPDRMATRSFIRVELTRVADSCGFGVPKFEYLGERDSLTTYADELGIEKLEAYRAENNRQSVDGLRGLEC